MTSWRRDRERAAVADGAATLDDAVNLVGVLLDALEQDADSRAEQARTVLAVESLHQARRLVDEQDLLMEESDGEEMEDALPLMGD